MKRIIHILSAIDGGGGERVVYNYYSHMNRDKVKLDLAVIDKGRKQLLEDAFKELGCNIYYVPVPIIKRLWAINKLMKHNHYDGIHCHRIFLAEIYMILGWINHIPLRIAHAHMAFIVGHKKGVFLNWLFKPLLKFFTTKRIACGEAAGRYVWGNLKKVTILNNAIDLSLFKANKEVRKSYRAKLNLSDNTIVVGHVGRFNEQKNHKFLLNIFNTLCEYYPNEKFELLMIGEGELETQIKSYAQGLKYRNNIHFLGLQTDIYKWMQSFDVFLLPSLFEGLPVVGVEAQAVGLPCVFSTAITQEFKIGKRVKFLGLEEDKSVWCEIIYQWGCQHKLDDNSQLLDSKGFNIETSSKKLENIYLQNEK